jgi:hypothetical protein
MVVPRPSVARFVNEVVRAELVRGGAHSDVVQRIVLRLHQELSKLIGPAGFDVLLARALVLAQRAHPSLTGVTTGSSGTLAGLDHPARGDGGQAEAATAIVSEFVELLVTLVGEDLAMRLVRDSLPAGNEENAKTGNEENAKK